MTVMADEEYGEYYVLETEPEPEQEPAADEAERDENDPRPLLLGTLAVCFFLVICAGLSFLTRGLEPGYSVKFTGVQGLDPSQNPAVSPAFNLTVHVNNKQHMRRVCQGETYLIVYYDEASGGGGAANNRSPNNTGIGWGKMPAFCVDRWSTAELDVSLAANPGVFLSQRLRDKMESHRQSQQMELSVEMKPTHPVESSRPCLTLCEGKFGKSLAAAPAMPCYPLCATQKLRYY